MTERNPLQQYPNAFVATFLRRLSDEISRESQAIFEERGISADPKSVSVLLCVAQQPATTAEIAQALGHSHQLASQRVARLLGQGLVESDVDTTDSRCRPLRLTRNGRDEVRRLLPVMERLEQVFRELFTEIGADVPAVAQAMLRALSKRAIGERLAVYSGRP